MSQLTRSIPISNKTLFESFFWFTKMGLLSNALATFLTLVCTTSNVNLYHVQSFNLPILSTVATTNTPKKQPSLPTTTKKTREEIRNIQIEAEQNLRKYHDNEAWNALFVSCPERPDPVPIVDTEGTIPNDFPPGCLLRLGPNGADASEGFFDGDGMIQCITFPPSSTSGVNNNEDSSSSQQQQQSTMSVTYIETKGRQLEKASGGTKRFKGSLGSVPRGYPMIQNLVENAINFQTLQAQKDTCNTALAEHGGRVLALMEQCPPTEIEIRKTGEINTLKACTTLNGAIDTSAMISGGVLSAHGRTCPWTGDRVHVSYRSDEKPYLRLDTFAPGWALKESQGIDIPTPIFLHDCAMTKNYVVILDLPLTLRTSRIVRDRFPVEYEPDHPARIGLVPRGAGGDTLWFDCEPGVVLHAVNAWETQDNNKVIVQGFRGEPEPNECYLSKSSSSFYHEYSIDLTTGDVTEQTLNPQECVEFPVINDKYTGQECPATYAITVGSVGGPMEVYAQPSEGLTFDSLVKFAAVDSDDYNKGDVIGRFQLPERWFAVAEPTVVPKKGNGGEYVLWIATYVPEGVKWQDVANDYDGASMKSKLFILDGNNMDAGPVYSATLPFHVNYGLHSGFIDWEHMK